MEEEDNGKMMKDQGEIEDPSSQDEEGNSMDKAQDHDKEDNDEENLNDDGQKNETTVAAAAAATTTEVGGGGGGTTIANGRRVSTRKRVSTSSSNNLSGYEINPYVGMKFLKWFESEEEYYQGEIISGPNESMISTVQKNGGNGNGKKTTKDNQIIQLTWHVEYDDGDEEDLTLEEIRTQCIVNKTVEELKREKSLNKRPRRKMKVAVFDPDERLSDTNSPSPTEKNPKRVGSRKSIKTDDPKYIEAKQSLCAFSTFTEKEVTAALAKVGPPYDRLQLITKEIHKTRNEKEKGEDDFAATDGCKNKFKAEIGLRIRQRFDDGKNYMGTVTRNAEWVDFHGQNQDNPSDKVKVWQVTYDDGDVEDMTWHELFKFRADRPRDDTHPRSRGRKLNCLEIIGYLPPSDVTGIRNGEIGLVGTGVNLDGEPFNANQVITNHDDGGKFDAFVLVFPPYFFV